MSALEWSTTEVTSEYNSYIISAAVLLCSLNRGDWRYCTQWQSGSTLWEHPTLDETLIVEVNSNEKMSVRPVATFV